MVLRSRSSKSAKTQVKSNSKESNADKTDQQQQLQQKATYLLQRVFDSTTTLTPEDAIAAAHWIRQILGIVVGIVYGLIQLTGFTGIMSFFTLALMLPTTLMSIFHELDFDEINKHNNIQTEGLFPAMALFVLSWTLSYTVFLR
ncbi:hypothetical protein BWQ96_03945 [Gracilariopsis chorda]|uniref:Rab5-interacting protein n=1 Tax=Gracilariopsis chorda TaxID=448386 RepID=A0A2V3IW22_9FLOR|nr:hypothetical protein BWQ96_03945 [Gracilariopsis chorda]|eukprot:PXF46289.1 hypothetical protein BWQ96_03945 [Gracilariopsis chorda]